MLASFRISYNVFNFMTCSANSVLWLECRQLSHCGMLKSIVRRPWVFLKVDGDGGRYRLCSCWTIKMEASLMRCFSGSKMSTKNLMALSLALCVIQCYASRHTKCPTWNAKHVATGSTQHVSWNGSKAQAKVRVYSVSNLGPDPKYKELFYFSWQGRQPLSWTCGDRWKGWETSTYLRTIQWISGELEGPT